MTRKYPFYIKSTTVLFGLTLFFVALYFLQDVLVPLCFALVLAILLNPVYNRLLKAKVPKVLAISLTLLLAAIVMAGLVYFLSTQMTRFSESFPVLKEKFLLLQNKLASWLHDKYNVSPDKQTKFMEEMQAKGKSLVGKTLSTAVGTFGLFLLIPVYVFLFLFYKALMLNFLFEVFAEENSKQVAEILDQTKASIQSYMIGLLMEALVVAAMNSAALLLLGVKYAILLGVIGALLNMLPYIGGIIAIALPVLMATITENGFGTQLGIIAAYAVIQFIDNNILVPRIVSSKVQINALISIVVVLLGGALWGVSGMFLSIPFVAILKIIFDRIDELKPWGKLLGDEIPTRHKGEIWNRFRKKRSASEKLVS